LPQRQREHPTLKFPRFLRTGINLILNTENSEQ